MENITRKMQAFGRADLADAVLRGIELMEKQKKECYSCEFFWETRASGRSIDWCCENDTETKPDNCCDKYSRG